MPAWPLDQVVVRSPSFWNHLENGSFGVYDLLVIVIMALPGFPKRLLDEVMEHARTIWGLKQLVLELSVTCLVRSKVTPFGLLWH